jgi:precorrin-2 dehydrogenase / sirohydrochlorin ferrochelatase
MSERGKNMYPVFLNVAGRRCLVVGGGRVAGRKAEKLAEAGARVTVVAPDVTEELERMAAGGSIALEKRPYESGEAAGYFLVITSTDNPEVNRLVSGDAERAGRPVNVVDVPELCNFFVPSIVRRGDLQIAISTAGAAPSLAKKIRKDLEALFPASYERLLERLRVFREELMRREKAEERRKEILSRIAAAPEIKEFIEGNEAPLEALLERCV